MNKTITLTRLCATATTLLALAGLTIPGALAHDRYLLPTHTVLSKQGAETISLTASISNDLFHPDMPLGDNGRGTTPPELIPLFKALESVVVLPDGSTEQGPSWQAFSRLSVADFPVQSDGTYRIMLRQPDTPMTTFTKPDGTHGRIFGPNPKLPEGTQEIVRHTVSSRVETYITKNAPTRAALKPQGAGIELAGDSHPNDLFSGETAAFALLYNGQPLKQPATVRVIQGGTRHRNQRQAIEKTTNANGEFEILFPNAGFYHLSAEISEKAPDNPAVDVHHHSLFVTLEVFPE